MTDKKTNFFDRIKEYFRSVGSELKRVSWPDRKKVVFSTILILLISFFMAFYVGAIDFILARVFGFLINLFKGF